MLPGQALAQEGTGKLQAWLLPLLLCPRASVLPSVHTCILFSLTESGDSGCEDPWLALDTRSILLLLLLCFDLDASPALPRSLSGAQGLRLAPLEVLWGPCDAGNRISPWQGMYSTTEPQPELSSSEAI